MHVLGISILDGNAIPGFWNVRAVYNPSLVRQADDLVLGSEASVSYAL